MNTKTKRPLYTLGLAVFALWSGFSGFAGNVYYASPTGLSTAAGTLESPYDAVTAVGMAGNGDEVRLLDGTYMLQVQAVPVDKWNNGVFKPSSGVTIRGWIAQSDAPALGDLREKVVLDTQQTGRCFYMDNVSQWMVVRDLVVTNACPPRRESDQYAYFDGGGVYLKGSVEALVTNCAFRGCGPGYCNLGKGAGAFITGEARIVDCEFSGNVGKMSGLGLGISDNAVARNCRFFNNDINAYQVGVSGAGVYASGGYIYDSIVTNNVSVGEGGGLGGYPKLCSNTVFRTNRAFHYGGGAAYLAGGTSVTGFFVNCTFENNWTTNKAERGMGGGAVNINAGFHLFSKCTFRANRSAKYGGAISAVAGNPTLATDAGTCGFRVDGCVFEGNTAENSGGALRFHSRSAGMGVFQCTFTNNVAGIGGGAIFTEGPYLIGSALRLPVVDSVFVDNVATNYGGALRSAADDWVHHGFVGSFTNCVFRHNRAYHGGAIYALGSFSNCTFEANQSLNLAGAGGDSKGGAVHGQANGENPQSGVTVPEATNGLFFADCTFLNNSVSYRSASAVWCKYGTCEFRRCDFTGNVSSDNTGAAAGAAAIVALKKVDTMLVDSCQFRANSSAGYGSAIAFEATGSLLTSALLRNSLFACNTNRSNYGGALALAPNVKIENCTLVGNVVNSGGGAIYAQSTNNALSVNCLFADNVSGGSTSAADSDIDLATYRDNCVSYSYSRNGSFPAGSHNVSGGDPLFVDAPQGNYRLHGKSPCVNAGLNQEWMTDAFDLDNDTKKPRIIGSAVDIGCYEYRPVPGLTVVFR